MNYIKKLLKSENIHNDDTFDVNPILIGCCEDNSFLHDNCTTSIYHNVSHSLSTLPSISEQEIIMLSTKLSRYHYIDDVSHIQKGEYIRWIHKKDTLHTPKLGGIVIDIKFLNDGTHIFIYNKYTNRKIQFRYDNVLLFQKLSLDEELILLAQELSS